MEKAWVAGCPLKVPKGQFPVKYTRTVPRRGGWVVSGREIDIKADHVYEGKYRNILFRGKYVLLENHIHDILLSIYTNKNSILNGQFSYTRKIFFRFKYRKKEYEKRKYIIMI